MLSNNKLYSSLKVIWDVLSIRRKRQYKLTLIMMIVAAFFEALSMGAVIPFLGILSNPDEAMDYQSVRYMTDILNLSTKDEFIKYATLSFGVAILIAGVLRTILLYITTRISFLSGSEVSRSIYTKALKRSYVSHTMTNSSEIINGIIKKSDISIKSALMPITMLIGAIILMIFIFSMMLIISMKLTLILILGFGSTYWIIWKIFKNKIVRNSQIISLESNNVVKCLNEGLGGIRDVILNDDYDHYTRLYKHSDIAVRTADGTNYFLTLAPRYFLETLGILLIVSVAYTFFIENNQGANAIAILGAFALGAQRSLPVMQQAYAAIGRVQNARYSIYDIAKLLTEEKIESDLKYTGKEITLSTSIVFENIDYAYPQDNNLILNNFQAVIKKGQCVGVVGKTGSGKSTLIDIFCGFLNPSNGRVLVDGVDIRENIKLWHKKISYVPQSIYLSDESIVKNIALGSHYKSVDFDRIIQVSKIAQIHDTISNMTSGYETIVGENGVKLSGGQRQRIGIARALYKGSEILIFDEATSALDSYTESKIIKSIESLSGKITIVMIAHRTSTLEVCDFVINLNDT